MIYPSEIFVNKRIIENCTIEITNQCNACCVHCDYPKKKSGIFLTLDDVDIIIHQLIKLGTFKITVSGGEPFEHPHVIEIIKKFIDASFFVTVITNGINMTKQQIEILRNYNKLEVVLYQVNNSPTRKIIAS